MGLISGGKVVKTYTVDGKTVTMSFSRYVPSTPTSQMFSYTSGEDVSCEEKKFKYNCSGSNGAIDTVEHVYFRRMILNVKTEYRAMTYDEGQELKSLVCAESKTLSLSNEMNGWWSGTLSETIRTPWRRVNEIRREDNG